jgi:iron(III) transport system substrate-binding protein
MTFQLQIGVAGARLRSLVAGLAIASGVGLAAAQSGDAAWNQVVEKARNEGQVNLYSVAVPQQTERLIKAFNNKYPKIRINHTRGAGDLPPRVEAERQAGVDGADVFIWSDPLWYNRNEEHLVPIDSPAGNAFPKDKGWQVPGKAANVGFPPFGILVWNTDYVREGLKDHRDLLKPELKGRIATREDVTAVVAGYLDFLEKQLGPDYLRALGQQKPKFYPTLVPAVQAVAAGEVWAANIGTPFSVQDLKDQGAPIAWTTPTPKGFANSWVGAVLKVSKRPNAARVFLDFILSPEGQIALNGEQSSGSAIAGLEGTLDMSAYEILKPENFPTEVRNEWRKKFEEYFPR